MSTLRATAEAVSSGNLRPVHRPHDPQPARLGQACRPRWGRRRADADPVPNENRSHRPIARGGRSGPIRGGSTEQAAVDRDDGGVIATVARHLTGSSLPQGPDASPRPQPALCRSSCQTRSTDPCAAATPRSPGSDAEAAKPRPHIRAPESQRRRERRRHIARQSAPPVQSAPCGCSSMVELQLPKLLTWVRFPSPAPLPKQCQASRGNSGGGK